MSTSDRGRVSKQRDFEAKNILPTSLSFRKNKSDPERYEVYCLDSFKILGLLGSGAFAEVFHVRRKGTREEYALKQIRKTFIYESGMADQLKNEVVYMHNLNKTSCENIVKLIDHFEDNDFAYLIMEYVKGVAVAHPGTAHGPAQAAGLPQRTHRLQDHARRHPRSQGAP